MKYIKIHFFSLLVACTVAGSLHASDDRPSMFSFFYNLCAPEYNWRNRCSNKLSCHNEKDKFVIDSFVRKSDIYGLESDLTYLKKIGHIIRPPKIKDALNLDRIQCEQDWQELQEQKRLEEQKKLHIQRLHENVMHSLVTRQREIERQARELAEEQRLARRQEEMLRQLQRRYVNAGDADKKEYLRNCPELRVVYQNEWAGIQKQSNIVD